jgi:hypothetical protein
MAQLKEFQTGASGDSLTVGGNLTITGDLAIPGNLTVTGTATLSGRAIDAFPSGTKMLFQQTAAPVGWTKDTTNNDKVLRIVSGAVGSGGTLSLTSLASQSIGGTSLTTAQLPSHTHTFNVNSGNQNANHVHSYSGTTSTIGDHVHSYLHSVDPGGVNIQGSGGDGLAPFLSTNTNAAGAHSHTYSGNTAGVSADHQHNVNGTTAATGSGNTHTHTLDLDIAYVDVIVATKN